MRKCWLSGFGLGPYAQNIRFSPSGFFICDGTGIAPKLFISENGWRKCFLIRMTTELFFGNYRDTSFV